MQILSIGIDPSLVGTAICAVDISKKKLRHVRTLTIPKGMDAIQRLDYLSVQLDAELRIISNEFKTIDFEIFIEGYAFGARGSNIFNLGEIGGIYRLLLARRWGGYYEIPPTLLKKFVTGKGNTNKQIMLEQTYRRFGIGSDTLTDDNQVDAYGLARMGAARMNNDRGTKNERDALSKIKPKIVLFPGKFNPKLK